MEVTYNTFVTAIIYLAVILLKWDSLLNVQLGSQLDEQQGRNKANLC